MIAVFEFGTSIAAFVHSLPISLLSILIVARWKGKASHIQRTIFRTTNTQKPTVSEQTLHTQEWMSNLKLMSSCRYTIWSLLVFDSWLCSASADGTINVWDLTKILDDNVPDSASCKFTLRTYTLIYLKKKSNRTDTHTKIKKNSQTTSPPTKKETHTHTHTHTPNTLYTKKPAMNLHTNRTQSTRWGWLYRCALRLFLFCIEVAWLLTSIASFFAKQMRGHSSKVYCLALQDVKEQIICSGSADTTIRVCFVYTLSSVFLSA